MRLVIAQCSVDYIGRLEAHLPEATRLVMLKADGSVSIHADDRAYKPLNWMTPPCKTVTVNLQDPESWPEEFPLGVSRDQVTKLAEDGNEQLLIVTNKKNEQLQIVLKKIIGELDEELGEDPGLQKDGVEAHLQELLADQIELLGDGYTLIRREYPTAIGPVDILSRSGDGHTVAVEIKRRGSIDGVEQLSRYLELLNRDELLAPVSGVFAAQEIKPQARTLAEDRGITCVILDYAQMRGTESQDLRLF